MKQLFQNLKNGQSVIIEAPKPVLTEGQVLIHTRATLISSGTERMLVDFAKASYRDKARQQPEKVRQVMDKIKTDGLLSALDAVRSKLATPLQLGYSNVGVIAAVGRGVTDLKVGERVVSNGPHADVVCVPKTLCARIPSNVSDESAAFTVLASIGLQGIRLAALTLGESVAVIGVGLIGLLTVQLLRAQGCRVLAFDLDKKKLALAQQMGAEIGHLQPGFDPVAAGMVFSRNQGLDAVLITAATTSNDPVTQAAHMSRKRGRIVLIGTTGLQLNRADFYAKELSLQVSCSYGPGRYDPNYEILGQDYPLGFVRWTEQRNFVACLDLFSAQQLNIDRLITHRFLFKEIQQAYQVLSKDQSALGILLNYEKNQHSEREKTSLSLRAQPESWAPKKPIIAWLGAGNYASRILLPAFKAHKAQLHTLATLGGVHSAIQGKKYGFIKATTDQADIYSDKNLNTIVIATRHDSHADLTVTALQAGKHVWVEKPLALHLGELSAIETAYHLATMSGKTCHLMVGFNRRFSPHIVQMKQLLTTLQEPKAIIMTMNAGAIPQDHWTQDRLIGGGRIVGEACHYIDLMRHLVGASIDALEVRCLGQGDSATLTMKFVDGSIGTIHYFTNGTSGFPKERIEVFCQGKILQLDNFCVLKGFGWKNFLTLRLWRQDKGQYAAVGRFLTAIEQGLTTPIPAEEIFEVARVSIQAGA